MKYIVNSKTILGGVQYEDTVPSVRDRVVQQALKNVLEPIFDPDFHPSSYGYRPGKSCHHAIAKAERFMNKYGLTYVADMDLSKCFDTLDHELIIQAVNRKISDGKILNLVNQFLKSGVMEGGAVEDTELGAAQGGPISPLIMNIYLDEFDQKMKAAGIRIVRYAISRYILSILWTLLGVIRCRSLLFRNSARQSLFSLARQFK